MDYTGDNKAYAVNWSNYTNHMRKAFDNLLSANDFVDVTLCCEGKKLGAHKMLLAACSNYFRDIFKEIPCNHPVVILKGVKYEVLVDIIQFIYNGEVSVNTENFNCFLKTAELLEISGLTDNKQVNEINETEGSDSNIATETLTEEKVEKRLAQSPEAIDTPCKKQKNNEETMSIKYEPLDAISEGNVFDPLDDSYVDVNLNSEDLLQATPSQSFKQENTKIEIKSTLEQPQSNKTFGFDESSLKCPICNKVFSHPYSLQHHKPVHAGRTECPVCHAVLSRKYSLKMHMKTRHSMNM